MATTIQNFFSRAAEKQFARDFLFRVKQINIEGVSFDGDSDLVYARSAQLPGRNIENKQVNYYGQTFNVPGKSTYPGSEAYSIEFFHDENNELRTKFEAASRAVFNASIRDINAIDYTIADGTGEILNTTVTFSYHFYRDFS